MHKPANMPIPYITNLYCSSDQNPLFAPIGLAKALVICSPYLKPSRNIIQPEIKKVILNQ